MIEDVKLALDCKLPVELCNRMGGNVPSCAEVCEAIKRIYKEYVK
jgi:2-oxoglutarate ferredoxin oxidoreductase subunit alpha